MEKITVQVDHNESARKCRADALKIAVEADSRFAWGGEADSRFAWGGAAELPLDVQFKTKIKCGDHIHAADNPMYYYFGIDKVYIDAIFNVELKEGADFLSSVLSGHLYDQMLSAREVGQPCAILVLATDSEIESAVNAQIFNRAPRFEGIKKQVEYLNIIRDFEAQCYALNVPVFYFSRRWPERLLSHAAALFSGGNLESHRPKVIEGERQLHIVSDFARGIGFERARMLLKKYGTIREFVAAYGYPSAVDFDDHIKGIGPVARENIFKIVNKEFKS